MAVDPPHPGAFGSDLSPVGRGEVPLRRPHRQVRTGILQSAHFRRRMDFQRQRVDAAGEFLRQRLMDHAMTFDPALPIEGRRHDIDSEMRFAAGAMPGVPGVKMRFIDDVEAGGRESRGELGCDLMLDCHGGDLAPGVLAGQSPANDHIISNAANVVEDSGFDALSGCEPVSALLESAQIDAIAMSRLEA